MPHGSAEPLDTFGMAWLILLIGGTSWIWISGNDPRGSTPVRSTQTLRPDQAESSRFHNFGSVLARGQTLHHEFTLTNPTDHPLHILGAEALTPCCSALGPVPEVVAAHGQAKLPVVFRPGYQSGRKWVQFLVRTDDPAEPIRNFALAASLISEIEPRVLAGSATTLPLGQSGRQTIRVICHRVGDEGRGAPVTVTATAPVTARFQGPPTVRIFPDGLVETTRDIEVALPPGKTTGSRQSEILIRWSDGLTLPDGIFWQVRPCIEAVPSGLVLKASEGRVDRMILLACQDRPFRVLAIRGPALADVPTPPAESRRSHGIRVSLKADGDSEAGASDLVMTTDHPDQPIVRVSVLVLPALEGPEP